MVVRLQETRIKCMADLITPLDLYSRSWQIPFTLTTDGFGLDSRNIKMGREEG